MCKKSSGYLGNRRGDRGLGSSPGVGGGGFVMNGSDVARVTVGSGLGRALARDVASLAALVASLADSVEGTAVGGSAVARDVAQLSAGVALHGLCLTVTSKVVGSAALVARGRTGTTGKATATSETAAVASAGDRGTTPHVGGGVGVRAGASQVARLTAAVAATVGTSAAQTKSRAVSLDMAEALAVVALLGLGSPGKRTAVGLVAGLLAVVAKTLRRGANLSVVANIATLVAGAARK